MDYSVFRFTLNMHNHRSQASVSAFRGDTAIRLCITISDGGIAYKIEDGCVAILSGTKADGTKLWNRCAIENNTIIYGFTKATTSCVGVAKCEITLYGPDGNVVTAPKFVIVVDEREVSGDDVNVSESEQTAMDLVISAAALINANGFGDVGVGNLLEYLKELDARIAALEKTGEVKPDNPDIPDTPDTPDTPDIPDEPVLQTIYYGVGTVQGTVENPFTAKFITGLTAKEAESRICSFTVSPVNQYIYFAAPKSYCVDSSGNDATVFTIHTIQGGFLAPQTLVINGIDYFVYRSKNILNYTFPINVT